MMERTRSFSTRDIASVFMAISRPGQRPAASSRGVMAARAIGNLSPNLSCGVIGHQEEVEKLTVQDEDQAAINTTNQSGPSSSSNAVTSSYQTPGSNTSNNVSTKIAHGNVTRTTDDNNKDEATSVAKKNSEKRDREGDESQSKNQPALLIAGETHADPGGKAREEVSELAPSVDGSILGKNASSTQAEMMQDGNINGTSKTAGYKKIRAAATAEDGNHGQEGGQEATSLGATGKARVLAPVRSHESPKLEPPGPGTSRDGSRADCTDIEEAEARAAMLGLSILSRQGPVRVILEMDSTTTVSALRSESQDRSRLWTVYQEAKRMLLNMEECIVRHSKRETNKVADSLAKLAKSLGEKEMRDDLPISVRELVIHDSNYCNLG
ncbi:hypothetical protein QYE76_046658 [Lolium multiflorum]|uniref:RNase H type-1 domain-containing protein n=1 Tax=Lolium multiflorum TaxID=4521 RepID=A0AAD8TNB8_LOLMU|nr:hypothetical protein QYE76_046658 [Lolium multiflorum]